MGRRGWMWAAAVLLAGCGTREERRLDLLELYRVQPPQPPAPAPGEPISIGAAVQLSLSNYPAIRAARARVEAAQAGVTLADTAYLPRVDLLWQEIRATRNNISGTMIPQPVIPGISGPVLDDRSYASAWGSNAGVLFSYEPIDFGLRSANLEVSRLFVRHAEADVQVSRLDAGANAAEAFLAHVAADQAHRATQSNVERWDVFAKAVQTLVDRELRPGVDASRAQAELALARNQQIHALQIVQVSRATLAEALGFADDAIRVDPGPLLGFPAGTEVPAADPLAHPLLARQAASVETHRARQESLDSAFYPRVILQLSANDRGSGFDPAGDRLDSDEGLYPDRANWAAGVSLYFPAMEYFGLRARKRAEEASERAERARADQIYLGLRMQNARVKAAFDAARQMAENTPLQLKAAREAQQRARARYDSGLGTLTEVAEAQRLLAQSEIDDALARLSIWRALAAAARVQGDLKPFLGTVDRSGKEK